MKDYMELCAEVMRKYPDDMKRIMRQPTIEYDGEFMGFLDVYEAVRHSVSEANVIVDLGCYCAAQAALFDGYRAYIGVDTCKLERLTPPNAIHHVMTIQDYIKEVAIFPDRCFAVCAYVPDEEARQMVKEAFRHHLIYYPT